MLIVFAYEEQDENVNENEKQETKNGEKNKGHRRRLAGYSLTLTGFFTGTGREYW